MRFYKKNFRKFDKESFLVMSLVIIFGFLIFMGYFYRDIVNNNVDYFIVSGLTGMFISIYCYVASALDLIIKVQNIWIRRLLKLFVFIIFVSLFIYDAVEILPVLLHSKNAFILFILANVGTYSLLFFIGKRYVQQVTSEKTVNSIKFSIICIMAIYMWVSIGLYDYVIHITPKNFTFDTISSWLELGFRGKDIYMGNNVEHKDESMLIFMLTSIGFFLLTNYIRKNDKV